MYEMLNGLPPFFSEDVQQMYSKIMKSELKFPRKVTPEAASLMEGLLEKNPTKRLSEAKTIKEHPYFAGLDWERLSRREITPPYIPSVKGPADTSCIDPAFTKDKDLSMTDPDPTGNGGPAVHLENFTYVSGSFASAEEKKISA